MQHWKQAQTRYGIHSPFMYEFVTKVLPHRSSPEGAKIEAIRKELARSSEMLEITDFGAGYGGKQESVIRKTMKEVVKSSARSRREGELLRRIMAFYRPEETIELGTNLGFSSLYLKSGFPETRLRSVEGARALVEQARRNFEKAGYTADLRHQEFDAFLSQFSVHPQPVNLFFLDGNHRYEPTVKYCKIMMEYLGPNSIIILDDINWSEEMRAAWETVKEMEAVTVTADLFVMGIAFVKRNQAKEHFRLRFRPF